MKKFPQTVVGMLDPQEGNRQPGDVNPDYMRSTKLSTNHKSAEERDNNFMITNGACGLNQSFDSVMIGSFTVTG